MSESGTLLAYPKDGMNIVAENAGISVGLAEGRRRAT
jgi:hypothetical protein